MIEVEGRKRRHPFASDQLRVGSAADNDVQIASRAVSRHHAVLTIVDDHLEVQDLGSRNGTLLNGARVTHERARPPATLAFGPVQATVVAVETDELLLAIDEARAAVGSPVGPMTTLPSLVPARRDDALGTRFARALLEALATAPNPLLELLRSSAEVLGARGAWLLSFPEGRGAKALVRAAVGDLDLMTDAWAELIHRRIAARELFGVASLPGCAPGSAWPTGLFTAVHRRGEVQVLVLVREGAFGVDPEALAHAHAAAVRPLTESPPMTPARTAPPRFRLEAAGPSVVTGMSPLVRQLHRRLAGALTSDLPVLLTGSTGVGKDVYARAIHAQSTRARGPYRAVNACAIPEQLLEAMLFGTEEGAATGVKRQRGLMREADGGTFFLDEIGDMPIALQGKILRMLDQREVHPIGAPAPVAVDLRVIAATHRDLEAEVRAGRFRQDLYFRLRGHSYRIPNLAERAEDIPLHVEAFLRAECERSGRRLPGMTVKAMGALVRHSWPGNLRELESLVRRLVHELEDERPIAHEDLPEDVRQARISDGERLAERLDRARRAAILEALEACGWNRVHAARRLGIGRGALRSMMSRLGIAPEP